MQDNYSRGSSHPYNSIFYIVKYIHILTLVAVSPAHMSASVFLRPDQCHTHSCHRAAETGELLTSSFTRSRRPSTVMPKTKKAPATAAEPAAPAAKLTASPAKRAPPAAKPSAPAVKKASAPAAKPTTPATKPANAAANATEPSSAPADVKRSLHHGLATPYGASPTSRGTNFALFSTEASLVKLVLYAPGAREAPLEFALGAAHRTGDVWHAEVRPAVDGWSYMWRVGSGGRWVDNECLDPWAKVLEVEQGPKNFGKRKEGEKGGELFRPRAIVGGIEEFDWGDVAKPKVAWEKMIVYEIHVRGFSVSAGGGGFLGVVERIPYLKGLGVNAVELLPVQEFNEKEWAGPGGEGGLVQYWGYSTVSFFAVMGRYGTLTEFKTMVRELHRAGIEVILDVVYNHTAEMGNDFLPPGHYGMKTLAPSEYYILENEGKDFLNVSGCGNTVNCNNVAVQELICESLKYWVLECGVDGFRFDLASALCRDTDGKPMHSPPVIERMSKDPTMRGVKLIAEPWDVGGLYQVGSFPHHGVWAEWNGKYRDCVRKFIKGDAGMMGDFATRLCGSADLYQAGGRKPHHSINFVTAHDGFSMYDLVSYNEKHNERNGENNNDGENHNDSWNCGAEGETADAGINAMRTRQLKNMLVALLTSAGTPMLCMGDEYGHTQGGNNNGWCQDSELTWFSWEKAKEKRDTLVRFTQKMVHLRRSSTALYHADFYRDSDVVWHGAQPYAPDWGSGYNFIAFALKGDRDLFIAFNAGHEEKSVHLPKAAGGWYRLVDTSLEAPKDFSEDVSACPLSGVEYALKPYSSIILTQVGGGGLAVESKSDIGNAFDLADLGKIL